MFAKLKKAFGNIVSSFTDEPIDISDKRMLEWLGVDYNGISLQGAGALKEATVYACVRILSGAVAKLPLKIYKNEEGIKKPTSHNMERLLKLRPNEYMTALDFFKCMEVQRNLHGNAFAYIEYYHDKDRRGQVKGLYPIDAGRVSIYVSNKEILGSGQRIWYVVSGDEGEYRLKPSEIIHLKAMSTDGLQGVSPIHHMRTAVESAAAGGKYLNSFYTNGMTTKGIVHYVGDLNEESEKTFRARFERMANGLKNANRISLLPYGYQFQPLKMSMADAQFVESHRLTVRQIMAAFGIKNHQLNDLDRATHTNISEQQREFYIDTLMEILTMYEQELNYKLFTPAELDAGFYLRFNADAILRADITNRINALARATQSGIYTPNEARELEEKPPLPGGDDLWANGGMQRLIDRKGKDDAA